jgi:hypothetical protein
VSRQGYWDMFWRNSWHRECCCGSTGIESHSKQEQLVPFHGVRDPRRISITSERCHWYRIARCALRVWHLVQWIPQSTRFPVHPQQRNHQRHRLLCLANRILQLRCPFCSSFIEGIQYGLLPVVFVDALARGVARVDVSF